MWLLIIFIIGISLLLLALRIHLVQTPLIPLLKKNIEEFIEATTNGDLLFFTGTTFGEKSIRWYHGSDWSHCSFVFRDTDTKTGIDTAFILESDLGQGHIDGPRVTRLKDKLKNWKGPSLLAYRKYKGPLIKKEDILEIATDYYNQKYTFDRSMYSWFFSEYPESSIYKKLKDPKALFCSELIADVLQRLKLLGHDYIPCWYTPEYFYGWKTSLYENPLHLNFGSMNQKNENFSSNPFQF